MRSDTWPPKSPIVGVDPMVFDGSPSCWIPLNSVFGSALRFFGRETQDVIPNGLLQIGLYFFHDGIVGPISGRGCMAGALEQRFSPPNLYLLLGRRGIRLELLFDPWRHLRFEQRAADFVARVGNWEEVSRAAVA